MKTIGKFLLILSLVLGTGSLFSQKVVTQEIAKPSEGKSLVYIVKSGAGYLINFRIYDGDKFLGALNGFSYMVYECEPGKHLFWAASENRDFIEADLEPNGVYVINAKGQMGVVVAGVNLTPLNPNEFKDRRLFYQVIKHYTKQPDFNTNVDKSENIKQAMEKYEDLKKKNSSKIQYLDPSWQFKNADKPQRDKKEDNN